MPDRPLLPESHSELSSLATEVLRKADAFGTVPTPLEDVLEAHKIRVVDQQEAQSFIDQMKQTGGRMATIAKQAFNKVRGVAGLRERAIWVNETGKVWRDRFPQAHETAHQVIPWHDISFAADDDSTLSPKAREVFEIEANFMAGELIFQGSQFRDRALSYEPSIEVGLTLAEEYEASRQSTLWKFVQVMDRPASLAMYYPDSPTPGSFCLWKAVNSAPLLKKFGSLDFPMVLSSEDKWTEATDNGRNVLSGKRRLETKQGTQSFKWDSWFSGHCLFVFAYQPSTLETLIGKAWDGFSR